MKYLKEYGFLLLKFMGFILGGNLILSLFYYLFLPTKVLNIFLYIYMTLLFFIFGFIAGKKQENKGFLAGLKLGVMFILILIFYNILIYQTEFSMYRLFYYILLVISSVIGSMLGINTKKE